MNELKELVDALTVVLDLARENALECDLTDENEELEAQVEKQQESIHKVETFLEAVESSDETTISHYIDVPARLAKLGMRPLSESGSDDDETV